MSCYNLKNFSNYVAHNFTNNETINETYHVTLTNYILEFFILKLTHRSSFTHRSEESRERGGQRLFLIMRSHLKAKRWKKDGKMIRTSFEILWIQEVDFASFENIDRRVKSMIPSLRVWPVGPSISVTARDCKYLALFSLAQTRSYVIPLISLSWQETELLRSAFDPSSVCSRCFQRCLFPCFATHLHLQ